MEAYTLLFVTLSGRALYNGMTCKQFYTEFVEIIRKYQIQASIIPVQG